MSILAAIVNSHKSFCSTILLNILLTIMMFFVIKHYFNIIMTFILSNKKGIEMEAPSLSLRFKSFRAFSFPLTAIPVALATVAVLKFSSWKIDVFILSIIGAVLLHSVGNLLNDYFDFKSGVDRKVEGDENRPGRFLVRGELTPRDILNQVIFCIFLLIPISSYIVFKSSFDILWFGLIGLVGAIIYTAPPFNLKYHAFAEPLIIFIFGPMLMAGAAFAQTSVLSNTVLFLSIPIGIATMAVVLGNNIRDIEEDGEANIKTIVHIIGEKNAKLLYESSLILPQLIILLLVCLKIIPIWTLLSLLSLIPSIQLAQKVSKAERIPDIDAQTAKGATMFFVLLFIGFTIATFV